MSVRERRPTGKTGTRTEAREGILSRWARFAARHRWPVILCWVGILAALVISSSAFGGQFADAFKLPGAESQKALDLLKDRFPSQAGDSATLVFKSKSGVQSKGTSGRVKDVVSKAGKLPGVTSVVSPFQVPGAVSENGKIAYATVQYDKAAPEIPASNVDKLKNLVSGANKNGLRVEVGGQVISSTEVTPPGRSEVVGLLAAVIILLVAFGSVVAMGLPVVTALVGLGSGFLLITVVAKFTDVSTFTPAFASMVGLGVGIDYALFVVTRFREGLADGLDVPDAVARAVNTAGRAVIAAGTIVVIALLGLAIMGIPFVTALGVAASVVVGLSVLVAVTLLPALLGLVGRGVNRWKVPGLRGAVAATTNRRDTFSYRLSRAIQRRPLFYALTSAVLLILLASPVLDMRIGFSDDGNKPTSLDSRRAYDLLAEGFGPGFNGPFLVAVEKSGGLSQNTLQNLSRKLNDANGVESALPPVTNKKGNTAIITVYPKTSPQSARTADTVNRLRDSVVPKAINGSGAKAYVGGATAAFVDIDNRIVSRIPIFFAAVIGLSFLLLMSVFRSVLVPLKAAIMNLLSIGAAYGVLVPVFQWGWGDGLLGIPKAGPIDSFLPMMLFAILFGLSMDYEVFLVSRIRESYIRSGDPRGSVGEGLAITARVITAAAAIMIFVFLSFVMGEDRIIKEFGLGLATAIFVDATVIRLVLVPATMTLLGRWNWWFPPVLDRLVPRLNIEGDTDDSEPEPSSPPENLLLTGVALEYLARRIENANGDFPNLVSAASNLAPDGDRDGSRHERARLAAREVLRPLAVSTLSAAMKKNGGDVENERYMEPRRNGSLPGR